MVKFGKKNKYCRDGKALTVHCVRLEQFEWLFIDCDNIDHTDHFKRI